MFILGINWAGEDPGNLTSLSVCLLNPSWRDFQPKQLGSEWLESLNSCDSLKANEGPGQGS